jgi:heme A synthase
VELNDWILSLHLLSAFALIAAEVIFGAMIVTLWRESSTLRVDSFYRVSQIATYLVQAGSAGTVIFGLWLSISKDPYEPWNGWIIAAFVLWAIAGFTGAAAGKEYGAAAMEGKRLLGEGTPTSSALAETFGPSKAFKLHIVSNVAIVLLVLDMIWKPGA